MDPDDELGWDILAENSREYVPAGNNGLLETGELYSDDVGCCIAVGVYDEENKEGYLSHLDTVSRSKEDFMAQVNEFLAMTPEIDEPEIVVTGGSYPAPEDSMITDFADGITERTYHIEGLKKVITRALEEKFSVEPTYEFRGKDKTHISINDNEGIQTRSFS